MGCACIYITEEELNKNPSVKKDSRHIALLGASIFGGLSFIAVAATIPFLIPAIRKIVLPFVPATNTQIANLKKALTGKKGTLIDLGSGDGRIVIEAARQGFRSFGVELNPWLIYYSRLRSRILGLHSLTTFKRQDLFKIDLNEYDNIVVFGVEELMPHLGNKIISDYKNCENVPTILACRFPFPHWEAKTTVGSGIDTVWIYELSDLMRIRKKQ